MRKSALGVVASCFLAAGVVGCGGSASDAPGGVDSEVHELEVYDSMSDGRDKMAMDSLLSVLRARMPDIVLTGPQYGATDQPRQGTLSDWIAAGAPPDSFETIGGQDLREWAQTGALAPLDALATEQMWAGAFAAPVLDSARSNGTLFGVPLNVERDNTLFYNKTLFEQNGIPLPTSMAGVLEAAKAFDAKGKKALAVSATGGWTIAPMLFDGILLAEAGPDFHEAYLSGQLEGDAAEMQTALTDLAALLDYANPDRASTGWSAAADRLCGGDAAMLIMPDFAKAQLELDGCLTTHWVGQVALEPAGTPTFAFVGIVFPLAKDALHPQNGREFLKVVGSKEGQASFNKLALTVPARLDVDVSGFDFMTMQETADFRAAGERVVPGYAVKTSTAFQELVSPVLQRFADPASSDHKNVNAVLAVLRDHYGIIRP
jgi:glucose/mannose transport system substrate-binding protein